MLLFDRQVTDAEAALDDFNTAYPNVGNGTWGPEPDGIGFFDTNGVEHK